MTEQEKRFLDAWRRAGPELDRIHSEELQQLNEQEGARLATLLGIATNERPRPDSGLVEFQQWMALWRRQLQ